MSLLKMHQYNKIVILTGAGISVASGLRPYRGPNGLWEDEDAANLSNASVCWQNPAGMWKLFSGLRAQALLATPNKAHLALAEFQHKYANDKQITLITQNIDGLHQRAGSKDVIELHGSAFRTRCINAQCSLPPFPDSTLYDGLLPMCPKCATTLRPDIVLFDEYVPAKEEWLAKRALRECELFLAIGTSGMVSPASNFVRSAQYVGAQTVLINLEPMNPPNSAFHQEILGKAEDILPDLLSG